MFSKYSRYRKLPDEVTLDVKGRRLLSKSLRLLPEVTGTFQHTLEESDRLDHLAYKYYKQPRKWWRLCDANPDFMWPQDLLGKTPFLTQHFPLAFNGPGSEPHWATLLSRLNTLVGVEDAWLDEGEQSITIVYNRLNTQADTLAHEIEQAGFTVEYPQTIGRLGKRIVIPPDVVG
jgi:hypothetical protein